MTTDSDRELRVSRTYPWPPERVFAAFGSSEALAAWWGPEGFVTTTQSFDLSEGGEWHYVMAHPELGTFPNHVRFLAVSPGEHIVYESLQDGEQLFTSTISFRPTSTGTEVELHLVFPTAEACRFVVEQHNAVESGKQTLHRLGLLLGNERDPNLSLTLEAVGAQRIVITRHFSAPPQRVFDAYTVPEQVKCWLGTPTWPMTACSVDLRVGGSYRYEWSNGSGGVMGLTGVFLEIVAPERLRSTETFDEDWTDGEAVACVTFVPLDGGTTLLMDLIYTSESVRDAVLASPMKLGMNINYNNLARLLAAAEIS